VTRDGLPVRSWVFSGETSDVTTVEKVKADLRGWRLGRCVFVGDAGMNSEANRHTLALGNGKYILATKMRAGDAVTTEVLTRAGRYQDVRENLRVKEVIVGAGERRQRYIVCHNPDEEERQRQHRAKVLAELEAELASMQASPDGMHSKYLSCKRKPCLEIAKARQSRVQEFHGTCIPASDAVLHRLKRHPTREDDRGRSNMTGSGEAAAGTTRTSRVWAIVAGVLLILVGLEALAAPYLAALVAALWIAWGLIFGGVAELISAFSAAENRLWKGIRGLLYIAAGLYIRRSPGSGLLAIALMLAWLLLIQGAISIVGAFQLRPLRGWVWWLVDGVITALLALAIFSGWPQGSARIVALLVGITLIVSGVNRLAAASAR